MYNVRNEYLPIFRSKGKYSGNPRNLQAELQDLQEPDSDDVEAWLHTERFKQDFVEQLSQKEKSWWDGIDFNETKFHLCGQSHLDIAWRWRYSQTLRKAIVTYTKALWHIEHHQDFRFAASQPFLLDWIRCTDPGLFAKITEAVKSGRFDLVGGMWVEPDCRLPSGESIVRQRLYGQRFYLSHFGKISDVEWVPDSFGFASTLPQIFLKSGSRYFYTVKLHDTPDVPFPFIQFLWQSPDGSRVLACLNPDGWESLIRHNATKQHRRLLKPGRHLVANYTTDKPEEMDLYSGDLPDICVFMGEGDGGHGPTGEEVAIADYLVEKKPFCWISATEYFQSKLESCRTRLPIWNDELYYQLHRGTLTTHNLVKRMNRYFEWRSTTIEALMSLALLHKQKAADNWQERMGQVWKLTLLNQFHDVLPGTSIPEVFDDCYDIWEYAKSELDSLETEVWDVLLGRETETSSGLKQVVIFNGSGLDADNVPVEVPLPIGENPRQVLIDGEARPVQILDPDDFNLDEKFMSRPRRVLFPISIPQHSFKVVDLVDGAREDDLSTASVEEDENSLVLANRLYRVSVDKVSGAVISLFFNYLAVELLDKPGIQLKAFFDWLPQEQCWNILPEYRENPLDLSAPSGVRIIENGPVRCTVEIEREIFNPRSVSRVNGVSRLLQRVSVHSSSPGIYLDFLVDWHTCECTLKCDIYTNTEADEVVVEVPHGTESRLTKPVANHDMPRWENYHHRWVDLPSADRRWGLAIINEGKYGYDAAGGRLGLTLLRGPLYPTPSKESWVHKERAQRHKESQGGVPTHADMGAHLIRYVILPHEGDWRSSKPFVPGFARWFNQGYSYIRTTNHLGSGLVDKRFVWIDSPQAEITAIKLAEQGPGHVVRIVELLAKEAAITVKLSPELGSKSVIETDLLERVLKDQKLKVETGRGTVVTSFSFSMKPHEIKTFLLTF
ncbi:MAG: alpha-mannosidase [Spirochaetaceae bacterium]|nr:MAG: alpha-mannosidase [Spirochaetaceae bacterium]